MKKKKTTIYGLVVALAFTAQTFAQDQIGIGIGTPIPSKSAILDISSTDKGVLVPRVSLANATTYLASDTNGGTISTNKSMLVFNTNATAPMKEGFYFWDGTKWNEIADEKTLEKTVREIETKVSEIIGGGGNGGTIIVTPPDTGEPDDKELLKISFSLANSNVISPFSVGIKIQTIPFFIKYAARVPSKSSSNAKPLGKTTLENIFFID